MSFHERVAVVTGAGGNIGFAICRQFARQGVRVAATDLNLEAAERTACKLREDGCEIRAYGHDVMSCDSTRETFARILSDFGKIDILVNNAGAWCHSDGSCRHFIETMPEEEWLKILHINLEGTFRCMQQALPGMIARRYGRIVNLTSIAGTAGLPGAADYSAAKAGVLMLTKTVAMENAKRGITVNSVSPGMVARGESGPNAGTWIGRSGTADEIARVVLFLADDDSGFITGHDIAADGGRTLGCHGSNIDDHDRFIG